MMLTPDQAAATWCPMVRASARMQTEWVGEVWTKAVASECRCIADKCAMWRWGETKRDTKAQVVEVRIARLNGVSTEKRVERVPVEVPHRGYCGVAGVPTITGGVD